MFSSLRSHLDFPEYILMAVYYRFIRNVEITLKMGKTNLQTQAKVCKGGVEESL